MNKPTYEDYDVLSFDCYGTLVDWEDSIVQFLTPVLLSHDVHLIGESILEQFAEWEPEEQEAGKTYRKVLSNLMRRFGKRLGFEASDQEVHGFVECIPRARPFEDTVESLERLSEHFDLAIISNIDEDLIRLTLKNLPVPFKYVITAESLGDYKPNKEIMENAFSQLGDRSRIMHVAQSLFHDISPARELGIETTWIKRNRAVGGAVKVVDATPDWTYDDLSTFTTDIVSS